MRRLDGRSDDSAIDLQIEGFTGKRGQGFPDGETKLGVETQRTSVVAGLDEPDAGHSLFFGACEDCSREFPRNLVVLMAQFDRDRSNGVDRRSFVEEVASDDTAVVLGDDTKEPGLGGWTRTLRLPRTAIGSRGGSPVGRRSRRMSRSRLVRTVRHRRSELGGCAGAGQIRWSLPLHTLMNVVDGRGSGHPAAVEVFRTMSMRPSRDVDALCVYVLVAFGGRIGLSVGASECGGDGRSVSNCRDCCRARCSLDITVPNGMRSSCAISLCGRPST
jgi:hypothetical protein